MNIIEIITNDEFEKVIENNAALIDFNAPWCGPCRSQEPIIEKLAERFNGRAKVAVINVDNLGNLAAKLGIQSVPTLIIFKKRKELQRFVGLQPESTLADAIEKALN